MNKLQLTDMLLLQDALNREINPHWMSAGYPWLRAVNAECSEAIDHLGWKWWAHQSPDIEQARMEIVDIWHFLLSWHLVWANGNIDRICDDVLTSTGVPLWPSNQTLIDMLEDFGTRCIQRKYPDMVLFWRIANAAGLGPDALHKRYLGKATLNRFRQLHGYAHGTYRKIWNGSEDNVVLSSILDRMPDPTSTKILAELERAYACLTERSA